MAKLSLTNINSGYASTAAQNANNDLIEAAIENTLSRDGTSPNSMNANIDMNGFAILNEAATSGEGNFVWLGEWAASTSYSQNNLVYVTVAESSTNGGATYICTSDHISNSTFDTDLSTKWKLFAKRGEIGDPTSVLSTANTWTKTQSWSKGVDITPGTAIVLGDDGNYVSVLGSGDITSISAVGVGTVISFRFLGVRTLVHSANLRMPFGGGNIVTAVEDTATFIEYAAGQWICISYQRADGTALTASPDTHKILQVVDIENYIYGSSTAIIPDDDTIPQISEGWEVLSGTFTPLSATSRLHITFTGNVTAAVANYGTVALFDGSDSARKAVNITPAGAGYFSNVAFTYTVARGSTVPVTFSVRYGSSSGATWYKNGYGSRQLGGVQGLTLRITEVEA